MIMMIRCMSYTRWATKKEKYKKCDRSALICTPVFSLYEEICKKGLERQNVILSIVKKKALLYNNGNIFVITKEHL